MSADEMLSSEELSKFPKLLAFIISFFHLTNSSEKNFLKQVRDAKGCPRCQNLGYRGRVGIFELMRMSDSIHSLVIKSASAPDIREVALNEGMSTLQGSGWQQIKRGLTTIDEVIRYADGSVEE